MNVENTIDNDKIQKKVIAETPIPSEPLASVFKQCLTGLNFTLTAATKWRETPDSDKPKLRDRGDFVWGLCDWMERAETYVKCLQNVDIWKEAGGNSWDLIRKARNANERLRRALPPLRCSECIKPTPWDQYMALVQQGMWGDQ